MLLTTALLQPKNHNQYNSGNYMALTTGSGVTYWLEALGQFT